MLELLKLSEISTLELFLGGFFIIMSIIMTRYIYKLKKGSYFFYGFLIMVFWTLMEFSDEFFVKNITREIIFNVGGRAVLIIGLLFLVFAMKSFLSNGETKKVVKV